MNIEYLDMMDLISCYEEITILDELELEYQINSHSIKKRGQFEALNEVDDN